MTQDVGRESGDVDEVGADPLLTSVRFGPDFGPWEYLPTSQPGSMYHVEPSANLAAP